MFVFREFGDGIFVVKPVCSGTPWEKLTRRSFSKPPSTAVVGHRNGDICILEESHAVFAVVLIGATPLSRNLEWPSIYVSAM